MNPSRTLLLAISFFSLSFQFGKAKDHVAELKRIEPSTPPQVRSDSPISLSTSEMDALVHQGLAWPENAEAQLTEALNFIYGSDGFPKRPDLAVMGFELAAKQGNAEAQYWLGLLFSSGMGVIQDKAQSLLWYRKAAEQGHAKAQYRLGMGYRKGEGVMKDRTEASKWFLKAADQGDVDAQFYVGTMYHSGDGLTTDSVKAVSWYGKAAKQGHAGAQNMLGTMYANGSGVEKNSVEAVKWFLKAAHQDYTDAQGSLAVMFDNGDGVPRDAIEGLAWSNIAASKGDEQYIKNRKIIERRLGMEATLAAQKRSKQILNEIEAERNGETSPTRMDSSAPISSAPESPKASGSGAIISINGYVLTASHVVAGASRVKVFTELGIRIATVLSIDEANDLAVLKLAEGIYPALPVAPSRKIRLGQAVATIGFPNIQIQGFSPKVTRGEVSSLNGLGDDPRAWQISVPVQQGNSGGPLLDENGNLVGVVVSKLGLKAAAATGDLPQNVNYAVKSVYALALLEPYLDNNAPEPNQGPPKLKFEDMVAKAQQSVVLILVY